MSVAHYPPGISGDFCARDAYGVGQQIAAAMMMSARIEQMVRASIAYPDARERAGFCLVLAS